MARWQIINIIGATTRIDNIDADYILIENGMVIFKDKRDVVAAFHTPTSVTQIPEQPAGDK